MQQSTSTQSLTLPGKVALVTGATSGIGRAAALALAANGAAVVLAGRREAQGQAVAREIEAADGRALFIPTDVTDPTHIPRLIEAAETHFGGLDIAFNNAGIEGEALAPLMDESEQNLRRVMEVNFFALWNCMRAEIPALLRRKGGSIINTTSVAGQRGFAAFSSYVSSKFAVEGLTRSVAQELATQGIRVNSIAPGPIDTDMMQRATGGDVDAFVQFVPMQRMGTPEEMANLVTFLASDAAGYVTGQSLRADGGMLS